MGERAASGARTPIFTRDLEPGEELPSKNRVIKVTTTTSREEKCIFQQPSRMEPRLAHDWREESAKLSRITVKCAKFHTLKS